MKFGMFYEIQVPRPAAPGAEHQRIREIIDQVRLAEEMGFEHVWFVEHHFLTEFAHSCSPEVFLGAVSQRTSTIRLGHAVVLLPVNHPVRVAEYVATLDIMSGGRVEFGTGRSGTPYQLTPFGVDINDTLGMWEEALEIIPRMWTEEFFEHKGKYYDIPRREVIPKPLQKPHPPLWVSGVSPHTFDLAAQKGIGVLSFSLSAPGQSEAAVSAYRERIRSAEPVGDFVNNKVAAFTVTLCLEDDAEAKRIGGFSAGAYAQGAESLYGKWARDEGAWRAWYGREYFVEVETPAHEVQKLVDDAVVCIGDPEACIRVLKHWEEVGVDQIMCLMQGGRIPHDKIMESIRLFGEHVIPYFKKRAGAPASVVAT